MRRRRYTQARVQSLASTQKNELKGTDLPKVYQNFPSLSAMMEFADTKPNTTGRESSRSEHHYGAFNDFPTWGSAMEAGKSGWPEGAAKIKALSASLTDKVIAQVRVPDLAYHDEGMFLDIERYRDGDGDCLMRWEETDEVASGQGDIRILMNVCVSSMVDASILQARGAAIIALTQALELVGKRVELVVVANNQTMETAFVAKAIGEPVQIDQLAFSAGSGDMFRRFLFSCWERNEEKVAMPMNYGYPANAWYVEGFDIVLPTMIGYGDSEQWTNAKNAEAWVMGKLKELGVELEGGGE